MAAQGRNIVVIGTSAGGSEALTKLISLLPPTFPAPLFIVQHMSAESSGDMLLHPASPDQYIYLYLHDGCGSRTVSSRASLHCASGFPSAA